MNSAQTKQLAKDVATQSTLQAGIVKRFMTEAEFAKFISHYNSNRKGLRSVNREALLESDLTTDEKTALRYVIQDLQTSYADIAKSMGISAYKVENLARRGALKLIYKNSNLLK